MQRRDFLKSAAIGCCGTLIGNSLIENAFAKNSINENASEDAIRNFLSFGEDDFKKLADTAILTANSNGAS